MEWIQQGICYPYLKDEENWVAWMCSATKCKGKFKNGALYERRNVVTRIDRSMKIVCLRYVVQRYCTFFFFLIESRNRGSGVGGGFYWAIRQESGGFPLTKTSSSLKSEDFERSLSSQVVMIMTVSAQSNEGSSGDWVLWGPQIYRGWRHQPVDIARRFPGIEDVRWGSGLPNSNFLGRSSGDRRRECLKLTDKC